MPRVRHEGSSGKSWNSELLVARFWGSGTCNTAGHGAGLGMPHQTAWSEFEYCSPQTFFAGPPFGSGTFWQPHWKSLPLRRLLMAVWITTRRMQRKIGKNTRQQLVLQFRFCTHSPRMNEFNLDVPDLSCVRSESVVRTARDLITPGIEENFRRVREE